MSKLKFVAVAGAAAATAAVIALAAQGAGAAGGTHKIVAGKTGSGTTSYSGKTVGNPGITFTDNGTALHCVSGSASGTLKLGAKVANAGLATIGKTGWVKCTGPGGLALKVVQNGVWKLNATGATNGSGVTPGSITNVKATVSGPSGCKFVVTGGVIGNYSNSSKKLTITPNATAGTRLTVSSGSCLGVVNKGDHPTFKAAYAISTPKGAVKITNK